MHPADILKTAIITPFGLFEFLCLTFGLRNAGSTFQRLMDWVLAGLAFAFVYLEDIIIAIPSRGLQAAGLVINFKKCNFPMPEVDFLGHQVSAAVLPPFPAESPPYRSIPAGDGEAAAGLLGVFNFYRRFMPAAAKILWSLTDSIGGSPKATAAVDGHRQWRRLLTPPGTLWGRPCCWCTHNKTRSWR
jgi:hypothetical protein